MIITEYNPNWRMLFNNEKGLLQEIFSNQYKTINHIGSTSIPNSTSKPIVDISIGVEKLHEKDFYSKCLKKIGYQYQTGSEFEKWILFKKRGPEHKWRCFLSARLIPAGPSLPETI